MRCIYCGRLTDFNEAYTCNECMEKIAKINERAYLLSLLTDAYPYVASVKLREKIETVIFAKERP